MKESVTYMEIFEEGEIRDRTPDSPLQFPIHLLESAFPIHYVARQK